MSKRREFLGLLAGVAATSAGHLATAARPAPVKVSRIRAVAFDLFTIFDPRSVVTVAQAVLGERAQPLCQAWWLRQFEYCWIQAAAGRYRDFRAVTEDALAYAAKTQGVVLSAPVARTLVAAYERLSPWPDARGALESMKRAGLRLAPLANPTPAMIESSLVSAGLRPLFDAVISTDRAKTFKPDPRAYALGMEVLGLPRQEIAFAAFGGWDAAGARWFGYPTFWVNRLGLPAEELPPGPDAVGATLTELASWVAAR